MVESLFESSSIIKHQASASSICHHINSTVSNFLLLYYFTCYCNELFIIFSNVLCMTLPCVACTAHEYKERGILTIVFVLWCNRNVIYWKSTLLGSWETRNESWPLLNPRAYPYTRERQISHSAWTSCFLPWNLRPATELSNNKNSQRKLYSHYGLEKKKNVRFVVFYYSRVDYSSHHRASRLRGGPLEIGGGGGENISVHEFFFFSRSCLQDFFFYMEGLVIFWGRNFPSRNSFGGELSPPSPDF